MTVAYYTIFQNWTYPVAIGPPGGRPEKRRKIMAQTAESESGIPASEPTPGNMIFPGNVMVSSQVMSGSHGESKEGGQVWKWDSWEFIQAVKPIRWC